MIELSSEASRAYEVKLSGQADPEMDPNTEPPPSNDFAEEPTPGPDEPEYSKLLICQHLVDKPPAAITYLFYQSESENQLHVIESRLDLLLSKILEEDVEEKQPHNSEL